MRRLLMRMSLGLVLAAVGAAAVHAEETIVFFRHGEKPSGGLGQLTCQGLNRALALPDVLLAKFRTPHYLYAPNPAAKISDPAQLLLRAAAGYDRTGRDPRRPIDQYQLRIQRPHRAAEYPREIIESERDREGLNGQPTTYPR